MTYQFAVSIPFTIIAIIIGIVVTEIMKKTNPRQWSEINPPKLDFTSPVLAAAQPEHPGTVAAVSGAEVSSDGP